MTLVIWKKMRTYWRVNGMFTVVEKEGETYTMTSCKELGQDTIEEFHFPRRTDKRLVDKAPRVNLVFDTLKQERMLANLSQLHKLVAQTLDSSRFAVFQSANSLSMTREKKTYPLPAFPSAIILCFFICL
jgi:hypothetical protein